MILPMMNSFLVSFSLRKYLNLDVCCPPVTGLYLTGSGESVLTIFGGGPAGFEELPLLSPSKSGSLDPLEEPAFLLSAAIQTIVPMLMVYDQTHRFTARRACCRFYGVTLLCPTRQAYQRALGLPVIALSRYGSNRIIPRVFVRLMLAMCLDVLLNYQC